MNNEQDTLYSIDTLEMVMEIALHFQLWVPGPVRHIHGRNVPSKLLEKPNFGMGLVFLSNSDLLILINP